MDIFFRRKEIVVDCFTFNTGAAKLFPISKGTDYLPSWWQKLPKSYVKQNEFWPSPTMKTCQGLMNFYKESFIMPLWSDLIINVSDKSQARINWQYADFQSNAVSHTQTEWDQWLSPKEYGHLKIVAPWLLASKADVKFLVTDVSWNRNNFNDYFIPNGIFDFTKSVDPNVNIMIPFNEKSRNISFTAGDPLVSLIPLTENKIKIKTHLVSEDEFLSLSFPKISFVNMFVNIKKNSKKESKCPFGFGN
jgi:hypothetical protein